MSNENTINDFEETCCCCCSCCIGCSNCWDKYKYHIIGKGSIAVSVFSSIFTVLDVYFPHYTLAKYISLGFLNIGIVMSGYAFGQIEVKADLLDIENKSLQHDKVGLIQRLTMYQFPNSKPTTQPNTPENTPRNSDSSTSTALPSPFNAQDYLCNSNNPDKK